MGLFSSLGKLLKSPFKAVTSLLKGDPLGAVKGLVGGTLGTLPGLAGAIPGVGKIAKGLVKGVGKLLPVAASALPMLAGLPPIPGLGGIISSLIGSTAQATTPQMVRGAMPGIAQQLFAGMPARGPGLDLAQLLAGLTSMLGGASPLRMGAY